MNLPYAHRLNIANAKLIALGNSDVLTYLGLDITALEEDGKITYDSNVKEVTTQGSKGNVDAV